MAVKRTWDAVTTGVNTTLRYLYRTNVLGGTRYGVSLRFEVVDGAGAGREISVQMSPDDAEKYAARIMQQAEHTRQKNKEAGYTA